MHGLSDRLMHWQLICLVQVRLGTEVLRTPIRPDWGSNSRPPDHDSQLHVTETPCHSAATFFMDK